MIKKFITTTLPYINNSAHLGHCFEFCIADLIADFYRYKIGEKNVFLNIGIDEHGQKIQQKSIEEGYSNPQEYCDKMADIWKEFCTSFQIDYNNFYRTTDLKHKENVLKFFDEIKDNNFYKKAYSGKYCIGCESFKTEKEIEDNKCIIHRQELTDIEEENTFFKLSSYASAIKNILIDKSLSKEFENLLNDNFDLSITRKNVKWGVKFNEEETIYVWGEALLNYLFSIKYYEDREYFNEMWENSLQICGKDNLKFQAYVFQAMLLSNNIPQTKELLVHGTILDEKGHKMSKSLGNVIDPIQQKEKFGLSPLKYYLTFGLSLYEDSKYSEQELINLWNSDIVNGFGNLISRTLHLTDIKNVDLEYSKLSREFRRKLDNIEDDISKLFYNYEFQKVRVYLNNIIANLNKRFQEERPFDKNCIDYENIIREIYFELRIISNFYKIILKEYKNDIDKAFNENKKIILFKHI